MSPDPKKLGVGKTKWYCQCFMNIIKIVNALKAIHAAFFAVARSFYGSLD
jgi:hypothetical protein